MMIGVKDTVKILNNMFKMKRELHLVKNFKAKRIFTDN